MVFIRGPGWSELCFHRYQMPAINTNICDPRVLYNGKSCHLGDRAMSLYFTTQPIGLIFVSYEKRVKRKKVKIRCNLGEV